MSAFDSAAVFHELTSRPPQRLNALPRDHHGIYALHDHLGRVRYVGITLGDRLGFFGRINNRHVTGSEGRSHKFSHAYNTGRMWRVGKDRRPDALLAKSLRTAFVRRNCLATFVIVPKRNWAELPNLEVSVQAVAPAGMLDWGNNRNFVPLSEPKELVDSLLDELAYSRDQRAAIQRQARLNAACARTFHTDDGGRRNCVPISRLGSR